MTKSRRAHAVTFGFDFQVNAAIVLMLENIKNFQSIRLEGNYEDIEILLENGNYILAQAKAIVRSSDDTRHVLDNLRNALLTLSEGASKTETEKLIFITNSPDPFNDKDLKSIFYGYTRRSFESLPLSAKSIIEDYIKDFAHVLDTDKFMIHVLPFETDDKKERYKVVKEEVDDFVGMLDLNHPGLGLKLMNTWQADIFENSTKKDAAIVLKKKDIIWPVIVIVTDVDRYNGDFEKNFDLSQYDEIINRYHSLIDSCCERCDFFIKVLYDYNNFRVDGKNLSEKCAEFALTKWEDYWGEFEEDHIDDETRRGLIQIILYSIVHNRLAISKIKEGVNL